MALTVFDESVVSSSNDPVFQFQADGDEVVVDAGVTLQSQGIGTISGRSDMTGLKATIDGTVLGGGWAALDAFSSSIAVTVGAAGRIQGGTSGAMALEASYDSSLVNKGVIEDLRGFAVVLTDVTDASVSNDGRLFGEVGGVTFTTFQNPESSAVLVNTGVIEAGGGSDDQVFGLGQNHAVYAGTAWAYITNLGEIRARDAVGAGILVEGAARIQNTGSIASDHDWGIRLVATTGFGNIVQNSGTISGADGAILGSSGSDSVTNTGTLGGDVFLGDSDDTLDSSGGRVLGLIDGGAGADRIYGGLTGETILGGAGDDLLSGGGGDDVLAGGTGTDSFDGGAGRDTVAYDANLLPVRVDLAAGVVTFPDQKWKPEALASIENATGGGAGDTLLGSAAANTLRGLAGNDLIAGGAGADTLVGGLGADTFRFAAGDSGGKALDVVAAGDGASALQGAGAAGGDVIDLSGIDANAGVAGDQAFVFGTAHGPGRLWAVSVGSDTHVRGNTDGDAAVEFELVIADGALGHGAYKAGDFIL